MLLVGDANIFMDFAATDLTPLLFRLDHELVVPDILFHEELASRHSHLLELGLRLQAMSEGQVGAAQRLIARHRGPSVNDMMALALASDLKCPLATGDARLRAAAQAEGVDLLGTLGLVEQMVLRDLISVDVDSTLLETMAEDWFGEDGSADYTVRKVVAMHQRGRRLWRVKVLTLKGMAARYRVLYAFDPRPQMFYILGIPPRDIAYDQTHPRIQRLIALYDSLGIT